MKVRYFLIALLFAPGLIFADPSTPAGSFPAGQPIESKMDLGFLGFVGGGMEYRIGSQRISRYEDFKRLIYPLGDEEASQLIRDSEAFHFAAWLCYVSGGIVGLDVALAFKPDSILGVEWFDRIATGAAAGEVFWDLGSLLDSAAGAREYNAVQRYNRLIGKKDQAFLDLEPRLYLAQSGLILGVGRNF